MKRWIVALAAGAVLCAAAGPSLAGRPALAVYGRLPTLEGIEISPDGKLLAITVTDGENRALVVRKTDTTLVTGVKLGAVKLRDVMWAGPEHLIVITSATADVVGLSGPRREYRMAMDFNIVTGKQTPLLRRVREVHGASGGLAGEDRTTLPKVEHVLVQVAAGWLS